MSVIRASELLSASQSLANPLQVLNYAAAIKEILTPQELLSLTEFPVPRVINHTTHLNFNSLWLHRNSIRTLQLLPHKTDEMRAHYQAQNKNMLLQNLYDVMGNDDILFADNDFPYALPSDVKQQILWIRSIDEAELPFYLAIFLQYLDKTPSDLILFERSVATQTKMVRGTFPQMRHIHIWTARS